MLIKGAPDLFPYKDITLQAITLRIKTFQCDDKSHEWYSMGSYQWWAGMGINNGLVLNKDIVIIWTNLDTVPLLTDICSALPEHFEMLLVWLASVWKLNGFHGNVLINNLNSCCSWKFLLLNWCVKYLEITLIIVQLARRIYIAWSIIHFVVLQINSLVPGRFDQSPGLVNFKLISMINISSIFYKIAIRWRPQHLTDH